MKTLKCEKFSVDPCPSPHRGGAPLSASRGGRAMPRRCGPTGVSRRPTGQFPLTLTVSCLVHLQHFLPEGSGNTCKLSPQCMRPEMPGVIGQPGGTEADGETSSVEGRMLRCALWIQSQRLHVEALAGWSPVLHGMAPFTNSCYWLPLPPLSAHRPRPVSTGFGPHLSYWYLKPCLNVCLLDKCTETLRRHWNWITHQSDGRRHPVTDAKSGSGNTGQLPGLLRRSPAVDPVQVEEEALVFAFLLVLETYKSGDNYKDYRAE